jgi:hypothetical protein
MIVTRPVAEAYRELVSLLKMNAVLDRRGQHLFCGGDDLFSWAAVREGLGFGIFPQLQLTHLISAGRLSRKYFLRLIHAHACSHSVMQCLLAGTKPRSMDLFRIAHLLLHGFRNGYFSMCCQLAAAHGEAAAAQFIAANRLEPLAANFLGRFDWTVSDMERPANLELLSLCQKRDLEQD